MTSTELDHDRLEAFRQTMAGHMNAAATVLMVSIGHRTGLFDTMATMDAATPVEIADAAGLDERYVREWLGAMATAGIVDYRSTADTYRLPPEHAAMTTRAAGVANLAGMAQFIPLLAAVEDKVIDRFHHGGGIPYSEYGGFHRVMADVSAARFDALLVRAMVPLVPGFVEALERGVAVADVACGSGHALIVLARTYPHSTFVGYDFSEEAIDRARREAQESQLTNVSFEVRDAATLGEHDRFAFITTFDAVHDQAHPREMVAAIHAALASGGYWLCADICASSHVGENLDHPMGPFMYTVSCMHCMSVSLAYDGEGLGAMWGVQQARSMFIDAGFDSVEVKNIDHDPANNFYVCHKH